MKIKEILQKIGEESCKNPNFIKELLNEPNTALLNLTGEEFEGEVKVEKDGEDIKITFPENMISEDELEEVGGGRQYPENFSETEFKKVQAVYAFLFEEDLKCSLLYACPYPIEKEGEKIQDDSQKPRLILAYGNPFIETDLQKP